VFLLVPAHPGSPGQRAIKRIKSRIKGRKMVVVVLLYFSQKMGN